jgi:dynein heavy chain
MEWRRIGDKPAMDNQESSIGAPSPRANMGSCVFNGKVVIFGGHGGLNYERKNFNDIHTFDFETEKWEKLNPVNGGPDGRGGCSVFAKTEETGDKIFVYGGWNSEKQYNEIWQLDLEKMEWLDCDIFNGVPRWNHTSLLIEAIPTWKFFIFGGECAEYNEGAARSFGEYVNSSCYIDLGMMQWVTYASDPDVMEKLPKPREYSAMCYDQREQRLILFGGWNNGWMDDLWSIKIGKVVGPTYAIMGSEPRLGQLSGNVPITITGQGFKDTTINVLFTCGNKPVDTVSKQTLSVSGNFVSSTEITCMTPSFDVFGPKEAVMQIQIGNEEISTTWVNFNYFLNTRAVKSLAYGPGCMQQEVSPGQEVEFTIQARNDLCENRTSGRDVFEVSICQFNPPAEEGGKPERIELDCVIDD